YAVDYALSCLLGVALHEHVKNGGGPDVEALLHTATVPGQMIEALGGGLFSSQLIAHVENKGWESIAGMKALAEKHAVQMTADMERQRQAKETAAEAEAEH